MPGVITRRPHLQATWPPGSCPEGRKSRRLNSRGRGQPWAFACAFAEGKRPKPRAHFELFRRCRCARPSACAGGAGRGPTLQLRPQASVRGARGARPACPAVSCGEQGAPGGAAAAGLTIATWAPGARSSVPGTRTAVKPGIFSTSNSLFFLLRGPHETCPETPVPWAQQSVKSVAEGQRG